MVKYAEIKKQKRIYPKIWDLSKISIKFLDGICILFQKMTVFGSVPDMLHALMIMRQVYESVTIPLFRIKSVFTVLSLSVDKNAEM